MRCALDEETRFHFENHRDEHDEFAFKDSFVFFSSESRSDILEGSTTSNVVDIELSVRGGAPCC